MADKPGNGQRVAEEIKQRFGFVPQFYQALPERAHDNEWAVQRDFEFEETVLPQKYKELIGLAVAAHIKCRYCTYFHSAAAKMFGATDEELREACFMGGLTVQFSNVVGGMQVDFEQFRREVDRGIQYASSQGRAPSGPTAHPHH